MGPTTLLPLTDMWTPDKTTAALGRGASARGGGGAGALARPGARPVPAARSYRGSKAAAAAPGPHGATTSSFSDSPSAPAMTGSHLDGAAIAA